MAQKNPSVTLITAPFILSYPKVLKPEPYMENGKPKGEPMYSFEGISDKDSLAEWKCENKETGEFETVNVEKRLVALAKERFGSDFDLKGAVAGGNFSWPFKSGDRKADDKGEKAEHYRGKKFWRAKALAEINGTPNQPNLYDGSKELMRLTPGTVQGNERIAALFYGGAICTAELNAVAGTSGPNPYVTFYVNALVFEKDGDRLGGGSAIERLRGVKGGETDYDPTQGMDGDLDDEIPF